MESPKLSWYYKTETDKDYDNSNEIYAGTYDNSKPLSVKLQLWNNRYGKEDVKNLSNFYLTIFFDNHEDNSLLKYCSVILNGIDILSPKISENMATITFPENIVLKGVKNNGSAETNLHNFINLELRFDAGDTRLKEDTLKSLYIKIMS